jgi:hypothetical protein
MSRPHLLPTSTVRKQPCCIRRDSAVAVHVERYECFAAAALIGNSDEEAKFLQPNTTSTRDISLRDVSAPALSGVEAMGLKPIGAGTVYGSGVMVVVGAVVVCVVVSLTVLYRVEPT